MDKKSHAPSVLGLRSTTAKVSDQVSYQSKLQAKDIYGMAADLLVANGMYQEEVKVTFTSPLEFVFLQTGVTLPARLVEQTKKNALESFKKLHPEDYQLKFDEACEKYTQGILAAAEGDEVEGGGGSESKVSTRSSKKGEAAEKPLPSGMSQSKSGSYVPPTDMRARLFGSAGPAAVSEEEPSEEARGMATAVGAHLDMALEVIQPLLEMVQRKYPESTVVVKKIFSLSSAQWVFKQTPLEHVFSARNVVRELLTAVTEVLRKGSTPIERSMDMRKKIEDLKPIVTGGGNPATQFIAAQVVLFELYDADADIPLSDKEKINFFMRALIHSDDDEVAAAARHLKRELKAANKEAVSKGTVVTYNDLGVLAAESDELVACGSGDKTHKKKVRVENAQPKKSTPEVGRGAGVAATSFVGAPVAAKPFKGKGTSVPYRPDVPVGQKGKGKGKGKGMGKGMASRGCFICKGDHLARDCSQRPAEGERFRRDVERANAAFMMFESKLNAEDGGLEQSLLASMPWSDDVELVPSRGDIDTSRGNTDGEKDDAMTMFITLDASRAAQALLASSPMTSRYSQARCDKYINEAVEAALLQYAAAQRANPGDVAGGGAVARDQSGWD